MMFGKPGEKAPQVSFQIPKGIDLVCFRSSQHWFSSSVGANNSCALLPDPTVVLFFLRIYQFFYGKGRCVCFPVIKTPQKGGPSFKLPWSGLCTGELEVPHGQEPEDFINRKLKTLRKAIRKQVFGGCLGLLFFFLYFLGWAVGYPWLWFSYIFVWRFVVKLCHNRALISNLEPVVWSRWNTTSVIWTGRRMSICDRWLMQMVLWPLKISWISSSWNRFVPILIPSKRA